MGKGAPRLMLWPLVFVLLRTYQSWALLGTFSSLYLEYSFLRGDFGSTLSVASSVKPSVTAECWRHPPPCSCGSWLSFAGALISLTARQAGWALIFCLLTHLPARGRYPVSDY